MLPAARDNESHNRNEDNENDGYLPIHHDFMAELTSSTGNKLHEDGADERNVTAGHTFQTTRNAARRQYHQGMIMLCEPAGFDS